jgi:hypothetical protein
MRGFLGSQREYGLVSAYQVPAPRLEDFAPQGFDVCARLPSCLDQLV